MTDSTPTRFLVQLSPAHWRAVDVGDVYFVEAVGDDCRVRLRSKDALVDVRRLAELEESPHASRVRPDPSQLPGQSGADPGAAATRREPGCEAVMGPPVNRVAPVSEERLAPLRERFALGEATFPRQRHSFGSPSDSSPLPRGRHMVSSAHW